MHTLRNFSETAHQLRIIPDFPFCSLPKRMHERLLYIFMISGEKLLFKTCKLCRKIIRILFKETFFFAVATKFSVAVTINFLLWQRGVRFRIFFKKIN